MKTLLAIMMVLAYVAASTYMTTILLRAQSSPPDASEDPQRVKKFKTAVAFATFVKYALVIGCFVIFFLHYQTLRHWVGSICFLMGLETLWTGCSMLRSAPTLSLPSNSSTDRALELLERPSSSIKTLLGPLVFSGVLLVTVPVFLFFHNKSYLHLSFWDLGGVVFFFASYHLWFVLRLRSCGVMVGKLRPSSSACLLIAMCVVLALDACSNDNATVIPPFMLTSSVAAV